MRGSLSLCSLTLSPGTSPAAPAALAAPAVDAVARTLAPPRATPAEIPPTAFRTLLRVGRCSLNLSSSSGSSPAAPASLRRASLRRCVLATAFPHDCAARRITADLDRYQPIP